MKGDTAQLHLWFKLKVVFKHNHAAEREKYERNQNWTKEWAQSQNFKT